VSVIHDTHRIVATLVEHGFTEQQATAVTEAIQEIDLSDLVTKSDLERQLLALKVDLLKWTIPLMLGQVAVFGLIVKWFIG